MRITNAKVFFEIVSKCIITGKDIELTGEQLKTIAFDDEGEKALVMKATDYVFSQSATFNDEDEGSSETLELTFILMNRKEYRIMLFLSPQQEAFLKRYYEVDRKGGK